MPKLQAGCTLTAQDGMVVRTAQTSAKAAEGQNATLEFILVNHPLDCPVCDKGGECPLQDLTFRYGPGQHADDVLEADDRQADPDLAAHRARPRALHPLLPLHALLRERRRGRRARRGQPRRAHGDRDVRGRAVPRPLLGQRDRALPRRRADLDRVPLRGAAVGDPERADGLRALPGRLQHRRDDARGEGQARSSRGTTPRSTRGWLCDKGRFAFPALRAKDRIVDPLRRVRRRGLGPVSWDDALDEAERLLREAGARASSSCSPARRRTSSRTRSRSSRRRSAGRSSVPEADVAPLGRPLSDLAGASAVVVEDDVPLEESAPIAALWAKQAEGDEEIALRVPRTPNGVGVADAVARAGASTEPQSSGADPALRLRRRRCLRPGGSRAGRERAVRDRRLDVPGPRARLGRSRPAGDELPRARRVDDEHGGPRPALAACGHPALARRARVAREARRPLRRRALARTRRSSTRSSSASPSRTWA